MLAYLVSNTMITSTHFHQTKRDSACCPGMLYLPIVYNGKWRCHEMCLRSVDTDKKWCIARRADKGLPLPSARAGVDIGGQESGLESGLECPCFLYKSCNLGTLYTMTVCIRICLEEADGKYSLILISSTRNCTA